VINVSQLGGAELPKYLEDLVWIARSIQYGDKFITVKNKLILEIKITYGD
jgi:hypothetical protein